MTTRPEQAIQKAIVQHLRQRGAPGLVFLHPANGGYRKPAEAAILHGLGVRADASDLLLWHDNRSFAAFFMSAKNCNCASVVRPPSTFNSSAFAGVAVGLDDALTVLEGWQLLRGRVM
jgi:hypothetical protein